MRYVIHMRQNRQDLFRFQVKMITVQVPRITEVHFNQCLSRERLTYSDKFNMNLWERSQIFIVPLKICAVKMIIFIPFFIV